MASEGSRKLKAKPWASEGPVRDEEDGRRRLVAAATRCIAKQRSIRISMDAVAWEAGVGRSTLYRYFASRDEMILTVLTSRLRAANERIIRSLKEPNNAARSLTELIMRSVDLVEGDAVNEALFSADSSWLVASIEFAADEVVDAVYDYLGPLLVRWQSEGQLYADLDLRDTTRWLNASANMLLVPPLVDRSPRARKAFVERYIVRALVCPKSTRPATTALLVVGQQDQKVGQY